MHAVSRLAAPTGFVRRFAALALTGFAWPVALVVLAGSCISPTLPLPPPTVDGAAEGANGLWELSGTCSEGGWVYGFNGSAQARGESDQGAFVACSRSATYALGVVGKTCDVVTLWESLADESNVSGNESFLLVPTTADVSTGAAACR